jgi:hypothetical protein
VFPVVILDQERVWVDPQGYAHNIDLLDEDSVLWTLDYALANARWLRDAWAKEKKETFDVAERARRWMLDRKVIRKLMRRLVQLEGAE